MMIRVNPNFDEIIRESMLSFLAGLIRKIEEFPGEDHDIIISREIEDYLESKSPVEHSFSEDLIDIIKNDYVIDMLENNKDSLENISISVKDKLIDFFIDFFLYDFYKDKDLIEVSYDVYIQRAYRDYIEYFEKRKAHSKTMLALEEWLNRNLAVKWEDFKDIFIQFKNNNLDGFHFLKNGFDTIGEEEFMIILDQFPDLLKYIHSLIENKPFDFS